MASSNSPYFTLRRSAQTLIDAVAIVAAFAIAYELRFEAAIPARFAAQFWHLLPFVLVVRMVFRRLLGLHLRLWRYVGLQDVLDIVAATTLGTLFLLVFSWVNVHPPRVPWGVIATDWWLNIAGLVGVRLARRVYVERSGTPVVGERTTRTLLVGAGRAGILVAKELPRQHATVHVVGFLDDDRNKLRTTVTGLPVLGTTQDLAQVVTEQRVDEIVVCIPSLARGRLAQLIDRARHTPAKVKLMPGLKDFIGGTGSLPRLREIELEDLLNREAIAFDFEGAAAYVRGRVVLVTGAGGSLGQELSRQLATLGARRLILVGRGEFSLSQAHAHLKEDLPGVEALPVVADVRDAAAMADVFGRFAPQVVFHAAAHKQVPLLEHNEPEAVLNNVEGTRVVAELARQHGAEVFVLLSTDKAVHPTSIMGATKRVAELIVMDLAADSRTRFGIVRFGNVLGSRGSVIPVFKHQIARGGPVTVTHPDVIRYFMTVTEATQLVLEAGAICRSAETYVLDMGQPIRMVDLAKNVIRLSGLEPDVDVPITFTGLQPGEKLIEEPLTSREGTVATAYPKLFVSPTLPLAPAELAAGLERLLAAARARDAAATRAALQALVPDYVEVSTPAAGLESPAGP